MNKHEFSPIGREPVLCLLCGRSAYDDIHDLMFVDSPPPTTCFACEGFPTNHNEACKEPIEVYKPIDFTIFHLKIIRETLMELLEDQFWGVSPASYISSAGFTRTITERDAEGERDRLIDELERSLATREWEQK